MSTLCSRWCKISSSGCTSQLLLSFRLILCAINILIHAHARTHISGSLATAQMSTRPFWQTLPKNFASSITEGTRKHTHTGTLVHTLCKQWCMPAPCSLCLQLHWIILQSILINLMSFSIISCALCQPVSGYVCVWSVWCEVWGCLRRRCQKSITHT